MVRAYRRQLGEALEEAAKLLRRKIEIETKHGKVTFADQQAAGTTTRLLGPGRAGADERFLAKWSDPLLVEGEPAVKDFFAREWGVTISEDAPTPEAIRTLVRATALAFSDAENERIYALIFEAQVNALREVDASAPYPRARMLELFEAFVARNPQGAGSRLEDFTAFLERAALLAYDGGTQTYTLTDKGRFFLGFLVRWLRPPKAV